jgi:hypothetical protein
MAISNPGNLLNSTPSHRQQTLSTNYLDFTNGTSDWAQQYLPDLMAQEAEVFGPRTISGFLAQVGAEEAMQADQVIWSEQGRLHLAYTMTLLLGAGAGSVAGSNGGTITITDHIDTNAAYTAASHGIRVNDTVIIATANAVIKALVTKVASDVVSVEPYGLANIATLGTDGVTTGTVLVYGSEFAKGKSYNNAAGAAADSRGANEPQFKSYSNKPIIMKDYYEVSGSDTARIGWVEIAAESGEAGYLWYLKAEADTRARFTDYIEMAMLEGELAVEGTDDVATFLSATATDRFGTQGLFAAIESRGNITTGVTGVNAATDLAEFDAILAEFDKQGAIEENMMFVNRATSLAMDDMLASMNSYGAGGTSYGVFDNSEDMALNLGFSGFRRGSYDFYKSDMRYLNDKATRGGINDAAGANAIRGVIIPAGTSTVYDQMLGKNLKRPFLHVRYRASQTDDRKMKTWVTGSVGAATAALDAMQIHMLTERCLVTQGANNFMLMK